MRPSGRRDGSRGGCETKRVHQGVDVFSGDPESVGLLENLGVVDGTDGDVLVDRLASDKIPAGLLFTRLNRAEASRTIKTGKVGGLRPRPQRDAR